MYAKNLHLLVIKLLLFLNIIYFVKTLSLQSNNDDLNDVEASGIHSYLIPLDNTWNRESKYEQNVFILEEKIKSLSETFNQLELKMGSLIKDNMDVLENNLRKIMKQIVEEKIIKIDQVMDEKINLMNHKKTSYNVHELKCPNNRLPNSCHELNACNSNIYSLMNPEVSNKSFSAVCDLKTLDGGWTIIQRRQDGSENFYRNWTDYVEGFGDVNGEFFIGLEKLYALTSLQEPQELYIILEDFEGERKYARYGEFKVDSKSTEYKLTVGEYSGNAGDCFSQHSGHKFTTKDRDNDVVPLNNCAVVKKGAWWYIDCFYSHLNGLYLAGKLPKSKKGISWCKFRGYEYSLKFVQMMIRPKED